MYKGVYRVLGADLRENKDSAYWYGYIHSALSHYFVTSYGMTSKHAVILATVMLRRLEGAKPPRLR